MPESTNEANLENAVLNAFGTGKSGTGEEELLETASKFSLQLSARQIRLILIIQDARLKLLGKTENERLEAFITKYEELKRYNHSDRYIVAILDAISIRRLINENTLKVDLEKK